MWILCYVVSNRNKRHKNLSGLSDALGSLDMKTDKRINMYVASGNYAWFLTLNSVLALTTNPVWKKSNCWETHLLHANVWMFESFLENHFVLVNRFAWVISRWCYFGHQHWSPDSVGNFLANLFALTEPVRSFISV